MISVIIPTRNDPLLHQTVVSLKQAAGEFEIIVVDDAGGPGNWPDVDKIIKNEHRLGPALARQKGADIATGDWLMFSDSHMSYHESWLDATQRATQDARENDIFCSTYLADKILDPFWHDTHAIGGADFYWWKHSDRAFSFADLSPRRSNRADELVPCILGACYLVHRDFFRRIGGFKFMQGYGSEEIWLSLACWGLGGMVRCLGDLRVIHRTAASAPVLPTRGLRILPETEMNRLAVMRRILPERVYNEFLSWLPIDARIKALVPPAGKGLPEFDFGEIKAISKEFGLQSFAEAIELMREFNEKSTHRLCDQCGQEVPFRHTLEGAAGARICVCKKCCPGLTSLGWRVL